MDLQKLLVYPLLGNFVCKEAGGSCECKNGWTGTDCDEAVCKEDCKGNDRPEATNFKTSGNSECLEPLGDCVCKEFWDGSDCEIPVCLEDCSGKSKINSKK